MDIIEHRPIRHDGRAYLVALVPDEESRPQDADCFTADDVETFSAYWRFITIRVMGEEAGHHASLSSVVFGTFHGHDITMDTLMRDDYCVPALLREVRTLEGKAAS